MKFFRLKPIYMERVWGGRSLEKKLGRKIPDGKPIGESWDISDRDEAQSLIDGGKFDGKTLREVMAYAPEYVMGNGWTPQMRFPMLVKWLDCSERLSLQVHPSKEMEALFSAESKSENWYVADCKEGAQIFAGFKRGVTKEDFVKSLSDNSTEKLLHKLPVQKGDSFFVPSGRVHAIGGGNLILEIQQNSDSTFRVFDWNRNGLDGKPRELHVDESLASIKFDDYEPKAVRISGKSGNICACREFSIELIKLEVGESFEIRAGKSMHIVSVAEGGLADDDGERVGFSESVIVPFAEGVSFTATKPSVVLITK